MWKQFVSHKHNIRHGGDCEMSDKEAAGGWEGEAGLDQMQRGRDRLLAVRAEAAGTRSTQGAGVARIRIIFPFFLSRAHQRGLWFFRDLPGFTS